MAEAKEKDGEEYVGEWWKKIGGDLGAPYMRTKKKAQKRTQFETEQNPPTLWAHFRHS